MKAFSTLLTIVTAMSASVLLAADPPEFPKPVKEHEWLKQFVGEWESESEANFVPGQPPMKCKGQTTAKSIGGFWVVSEMKSEMMGVPMVALQTLGYDTAKKKYVGTWIDSMMNYMWTYDGEVDETGKILTMTAEGPSMTDPTKTAKYRDVYEFKSKDNLAISSSMQGEDGEWVPFMTGNAKRKGTGKSTENSKE